MPMKVTHQAGAAPLGLLVAANMDGPLWARAGAGLLTWGVSTINDWDHNNYRRRMHFGAAVVRWSARWGYRLQARNDVRARHKLSIDDLHRGPSHALEWCALLGLLTALVALTMPPLAPHAWWFGLAVFAGTASHVLLDWMTPSGVPLSIIWNYVAWSVTAKRRAEREVWRRHACGWWVPFYEVSWWLRWVRLPRPMSVDDRHPGCEPGLFHTNEGGEHLIVVPVLYAASATALLGIIGLLDPLATFLVPWLA